MPPKKPASERKKTGPKGPTKYEKKLAERLAALGSKGEGVVEACLTLGISKETFYEWGRKFPEFSDAIKQFKLRSQVWWESGGRAGTFGKVAGFNASAYSLQMRNRFPDDWRDKVENDHTSSDGTMTPPTTVVLRGVKPDDASGD